MDKVVLTILGSILISFAGMVGYWFQDRRPPTEIKREEIVTPAVNPGDLLLVEIETFRHRNDCRVHIERQIYDGERNRIPMPDEDFEAQPGPLGTSPPFRDRMRVPSDAAPGEAFYRAIRSYWCNPLQRFFNWPVTVRTVDHPFRIVQRR